VSAPEILPTSLNEKYPEGIVVLGTDLWRDVVPAISRSDVSKLLFD
jgi:hypothetical protein